VYSSKSLSFTGRPDPYSAYSEAIQDLDWTSTVDPQSQSILAIGFAQHVLLLCQQRLTYFDDETAWSEVGRVELSQYVPSDIFITWAEAFF
jgi:hypothetical protein